MEKFKVGIIGTGGISLSHLNGYRQLDYVEVAACCDIDAQKAETYAKNNNIPHWYASAEEMFKNEQLDAVSVCTWNNAHKECTVTALKAGAHVLCEKPMAMNAQEAEEMRQTALDCGKLLQVGFVRRFGDDAATLKHFINEGLFGDLYYAKAQYVRRNGCPGGWFGDKRYSGGGPLIDLGVHVMDLVRYLGGGPKPISVYGAAYNNLGKNRAEGSKQGWSVEEDERFEYNVEDFATAYIRFDNGLVMQMEAAFNLNIKENSASVQLFGTKGGATITPQFELFTDLAGRFVNVQTAAPVAFNFGGAFDAEIKGFVDAAMGKEPCRAPAEDGVVLMRIIDAIYESARTGHEVVL